MIFDFFPGSVTLRQWQQLATQNIGGIFESRPGVQIKGERKLDLEEEQHNLSDLEEDGKSKINVLFFYSEPNFRATVVPLKRGHPSYKATF